VFKFALLPSKTGCILDSQLFYPEQLDLQDEQYFRNCKEVSTFRVDTSFKLFSPPVSRVVKIGGEQPSDSIYKRENGIKQCVHEQVVFLGHKFSTQQR